VPTVDGRPGVTSHGLTEAQALEKILGAGQETGDRQADLLQAARSLTLHKGDEYPNLLRVILHGLYQDLKDKGEKGDVWLAVGRLIGQPGKPVSKTNVWRWAHPPGLEVEE
jgi:hypothetical protein